MKTESEPDHVALPIGVHERPPRPLLRLLCWVLLRHQLRDLVRDCFDLAELLAKPRARVEIAHVGWLVPGENGAWRLRQTRFDVGSDQLANYELVLENPVQGLELIVTLGQLTEESAQARREEQ